MAGSHSAYREPLARNFNFLRNYLAQKSMGFNVNEKTCNGFTLMEILIAISIIAIALLAAHRMQSQTLIMAQSAKFYTIAPLLAQSKMADFQLVSGNELADNSDDFGDDYPGYTWKATVGDVTSDILGQTAEDLKQIDLTVSYRSGEFEFSTRQYRFMR